MFKILNAHDPRALALTQASFSSLQVVLGDLVTEIAL